MAAVAKDETTEEVTTEETTAAPTEQELEQAREQDNVQEAVEGAQDEAVNGRQLEEANDPVLGDGEPVDPLEQGKSDSVANHEAHRAEQPEA